MRAFDVQVSVIEPGATRTPVLNEELLTDRLNDLWDKLPPERQLEYGEDYLKACKCMNYSSKLRLESYMLAYVACFGWITYSVASHIQRKHSSWRMRTKENIKLNQSKIPKLKH